MCVSFQNSSAGRGLAEVSLSSHGAAGWHAGASERRVHRSFLGNQK
jgi:hypothetical protein